MRIKINKKTKELILTHSEARKDYVVSVYLEKPIYNKLDQIFKDIASKQANIVIVPEMGYIFTDESASKSFVHGNGRLLREGKVGVFTQGNFSVNDIEVKTFGINNEYILVRAGKLTIGVISQYVSLENLSIENMPDEIQNTQIIIAPEKFASKLLTGDFSVYIFYGNPDDFKQQTGIANFEVRDNLNIKKVETTILDTRTIYFFELS